VHAMGQLLLWKLSFPHCPSQPAPQGWLEQNWPLKTNMLFFFFPKAELFWNLSALDTCLQAFDAMLNTLASQEDPALLSCTYAQAGPSSARKW
jgi:hypothetical protein